MGGKKATSSKKKSVKKSKKEEVDEEINQPLFYKMDDSLNISKETKTNRRYSLSRSDNGSSDGRKTKILHQSEIETEENLIQDETMIKNLAKNFTEFAQENTDTKLSMIQANSCEKSPISKIPHGSDDRGGYQASTYYSNTMNKSSKKSGFQFSSDLFGFEDGEVNQSKGKKNNELIGILSEDDFEKISHGIKDAIDKKNTRDSNKLSQGRPFPSCVEDPNAEDDNSL